MSFDGDSMFKQRADEAEKAFVESEKSIESIDEVLGYMDAMNYDLKTGYDATVSDAIAKFMGTL
mgnify:CR=1 FL=1